MCVQFCARFHMFCVQGCPTFGVHILYHSEDLWVKRGLIAGKHMCDTTTSLACRWSTHTSTYTYHLHTLYPHTYVHTASCVHVVCRIYLPGKESEQYRGDRKRGREARRTAQTTNAFLFTCCHISSCKVQLHPLYTCTSCSSLYIHKALYTHTTQGLASVHTCVCDAVYVCISLASVHTKYNSRVVTHK